jgi:hypothetical protein
MEDAARLTDRAVRFAVRGVVTALSPVIPHRDGPIFFAQLASRAAGVSATVMFLNKSSHLRQVLWPQHEYVVTSVRLSELFKDQDVLRASSRFIIAAPFPPCGGDHSRVM